METVRDEIEILERCGVVYSIKKIKVVVVMSFSINVMYDAEARVRKLGFVMTFMCRRNPILILDGTDPSPDTPGTPEMS